MPDEQEGEVGMVEDKAEVRGTPHQEFAYVADNRDIGQNIVHYRPENDRDQTKFT